MFTITSEVAKLIQSGASKEKAARAAKRQAIDLIVAQGGRGHHFTKDAVKDGLVAKETLQGVQILIAKGLLNSAEFALWATDSKEANKQGKQAERNKLTSDVNAYLASFRKMVETQWALSNPDAAKAEEAAKKSELSEEKSELPEAAPSAKVLTLELLQKFINDLTLEVSASKDASIVAQRAKLIPALNALQDICSAH